VLQWCLSKLLRWYCLASAHQYLREQDLLNYLALQDYQKAISLALAMEQPGRLFNLLRDVRLSATKDLSIPPIPTITGHFAVDEVIRTLEGTELTKLLSYLRDWNARAKTSVVAQDILFAVVKLRPADEIMNAFKDAGALTELDASGTIGKESGSTALKGLIDAIIPYTERHLARMDKLVQESYIIDHLLFEMDTLLDEEEAGIISQKDEEDDEDAVMDVDNM
jgi:U3 small nucleolar RNA-associated protein 13